MTERERPQERSQGRRGHHHMPQHQPGRPGAQHVHVIDAVSAGEHPVHQAHHLAARQRRARSPGIEPHTVVHQPLNPQPPGQRPGQQQPRIADQPLLIEPDRDLIEARGSLDNVRAIVHHSGDLLTGPRLPHTTAEKPRSGGQLNVTAGRNHRHYAVDPGLVRSSPSGAAGFAVISGVSRASGWMGGDYVSRLACWMSSSARAWRGVGCASLLKVAVAPGRRIVLRVRVASSASRLL